MAKKQKKGPAARPPVREEKAPPRFPAWAAWAAFLFWPFWVLKQYFGRFRFSLDNLPVMLAPGQYFGDLLSVAPGHFAALLGCASFLFACYGPGRLALRAAGFSFASLAEEAVFALGAGLGLLSVAMLGLGLAGLVYPVSVVMVLAAGAGAGAADLYRNPPAYGPSPRACKGLLDWLAAALLFAALGVTLVGALAPEIFYDALIYHLAVPNFYAIEHKITLMPFNAFSNLPLTHGMLYMAALSVGGVPLAKLVNYSTYALTALAAFAIGARFFTARAGLWAALIFATVVHSMIGAWSAGTEMPLALFTALALHAVLLRGATGEKRWFVLAGCFCGLSMGVKYTGLFTAVAAGAVFLWQARADLRGAAKELAWFSLAASFFIAPWLVKNWLHTANPFHPMLNGLFPPNAGSDPEKLKMFVAESRQMGVLTLKGWLTAPWEITLGRVGNSELFSPLFLAFLPLLFLLAPAGGAGLSGLGIFFAALWLTWSFSSTMIRFLIPGYPAAGLLIGVSLLSAGHETLKLLLRAATLCVCFTGLYWGSLTFYGQGRWAPVFGKVDKHEYLSRTQPTYPYPHYAAIKYINENLPDSSRTLVVGDGRSLYFKKPFLVGTAFDKSPLEELVKASSSGEDLYRRLRERGVTHLLVNAAEGARLARDYGMFRFSPAGLAAFNSFWSAHAKEIYGYDDLYQGRPINRVAVYELLDKAPAPPPRNFVAELAAAKG